MNDYNKDKEINQVAKSFLDIKRSADQKNFVFFHQIKSNSFLE